MKTIYKIIIAAFTFAIISNTIQAQIVDVCADENGITLRTGNYQYGTVEWESSYDNENWTKIPGAKDTTYSFIPTETKYYRAVAKFSECQPEYSEVSLVQMPPVANAGTDRTVPGNSVFMMANLQAGETGNWAIISGDAGIFTDVANPYSEFSGTNSSYSLEWTVTNACDTDKNTIDVDFRENIYIESIVVVDETDTILSTPVQLEAGEYIIGFNTPVPQITDTTVLVGIVGEGFLRKVISFTQNADTFYMQTEQASLEDVTISGAYDLAQVFNIDTTLTETKSTNYRRLDHLPTRAELLANSKFKKGNYYYIVKDKPVYIHPGVSVQNSSAKNGSTSIGLNFNKTILNTGNVNIELNGNYNFTPNIKSELDRSGLHVNSFNMGMYNGTIERNYELALNASGSASLINQEFTLLSVEKLIILVIGGFPLAILTEFNIDGQISADISASMNITHHYNKTSVYTAAIEYENGQWDYIYNENDYVQTDNSFTVSGDLNQTFDIGPNIIFKIVGVVGPYLDTRLTEELNLCLYNNNWKANMDIGGELTVGARAEALGYTLFDISKTWEQGFYNMQFPYELEMISGNNQTYDLGSLTYSTSC